jgi:ribose 5-phosphate isomerase B
MSPNLTLNLATDHAGFLMKEEIAKWLKAEGWRVVDHGAYHEDSEDDFPDFIAKAAKAVSAASDTNVAIIFGGSGQGEAMVSNRFSNVRAVVYYGGNLQIISLARQHNDSNVLSFGARFLSVEEAKTAIALWLKEPKDDAEKRMRRNRKIEALSRLADL